MAACSSEAHGDTNEGLPEETGLTNSRDVIIEEIFKKCDTDHTGTVNVCTIIEFVAKYFENCPSDWRLQELKGYLDPKGKNLSVDKATFSDVWPKWISRIKQGELNTSEDGRQKDFEVTNCKNVSFLQSTPRSNIHQMSGYGESNLTDISLNSSFGILEAPSVALSEDHQERINELMYQNKNLLEELCLIKNQLSNSEEQNESLQKDLESFKKRVHFEQQKCEEFNNLQTEYETIRETYEMYKKDVEKLQRKLSLAKKENAVLSSKIDTLEMEKKIYEEKLEKAKENLEKAIADILKLQADVSLNEQEVLLLRKENSDLLSVLNEQKRDIEYFKNESEKYKAEKITLEKHITTKELGKGMLIKQLMSKQSTHSTSSPTQMTTTQEEGEATQFSPPIPTEKFKFYNYDSPFARVVKEPKVFSSSKFIQIEREPNSVCSCISKTSVDSESPNFKERKEDISYQALESTPKEAVSERNLLDVTVPEMTNSPALIPTTDVKNNVTRIEPVVLATCEGSKITQNVNQESIFNLSRDCLIKLDESQKSLPCMYIVERSTDVKQEINPVQDLMVEVNELEMQETSSEQDLFWKLHFLNNSQEPHENLQEEMSQAEQFNVDDELLYEHKETSYVSIRCNTKNHNCTHFINKQKEEISRLEIQQNECLIKLQDLLTEISELKVSLAVEEDKNRLLNKENAELKEELDGSKSYVSDVEQELIELKELKIKYNELKTLERNLQDENSQKYVEILNLQNANESLEKKLQGEISTQKEDLEQCRQQMIDLTNLNNQLSDKVSSLTADNLKLLAQTKNTQELNEEITDKMNVLSGKFESVRENLEIITQDNVTLQKQLKEKDALQLTIDDLKKEMEFLKDELVCKEAFLKEKELEHLRGEEKLLEQLKEITTKHEETKKRYGQLEKTFSSKLVVLEKNVNELNEMLKQREDFATELMKDLKLQKDANNNLQKGKKELEKGLKLLEISNSEKDKQMSTLERYKNEYQKKIEELTKKLMQATSEKDQLMVQIKNLEMKLKNIETRFEESYDSLQKEKMHILNKYQLFKSEVKIFVDRHLQDIKQKDESTKAQECIIESELNELKAKLYDTFNFKDLQLQKVMKEKDAVSKECSILKGRLGALSAEKKNSTEVIEELRSNLENALFDLNNMELKMKLKDEALCQNCKELVEVKQQLSYLEHVNTALLQENESLKQKCEQYDMDSISESVGCSNCDSLKDRILALEGQLTVDRTSGKGNYNRLIVKNNRLESKLELLKENMEAERKRFEANVKESLLKDEQISNLRLEKENLQIQLRNSDDRTEEMRKQNENAIKTVCAILNDKVEQIRKIIGNVQSELERKLNESANKFIKFSKRIDLVKGSMRTNARNVLQETKPNTKKFILRPARLIVRPVSPDSPSLEMVKTAESPNKTNLAVHKDHNGNISPEPLDKNKSEAVEEICQSTTDSSQDAPSNKCGQTYNKIITNPSPSFTEAFLNKLQLFNIRTNMSQKEMTEKFIQLALAFTADKESLEERLETQERHHCKLETLMVEEVARLNGGIGSLLLRPGYAREEVMALQRCTEKILEAVSQVTMSAVRLGALKHEKKLMPSVILMINHVALQKRNKEKYAKLLRPTNHQNLNESTMTAIICSSEKSPTKPDVNTSNGPSSSAPVFEGAIARAINLFKGWFQWDVDSVVKDFILTMSFLIFLLTIILLGNMVLEVEFSRRGLEMPRYPFRLTAWNEFWDRWLKKEYPFGPPPT